MLADTNMLFNVVCRLANRWQHLLNIESRGVLLNDHYDPMELFRLLLGKKNCKVGVRFNDHHDRKGY